MNTGDTFDVPLYVRVSKTEDEKSGDTSHRLVIVCNGFDVAQLNVTFFKSEESDEDAKRDSVRRAVAVCLARAISQAELVAGDKKIGGPLVRNTPDTGFN